MNITSQSIPSGYSITNNNNIPITITIYVTNDNKPIVFDSRQLDPYTDTRIMDIPYRKIHIIITNPSLDIAKYVRVHQGTNITLYGLS